MAKQNINVQRHRVTEYQLLEGNSGGRGLHRGKPDCHVPVLCVSVTCQSSCIGLASPIHCVLGDYLKQS